MGMFSFLGDLFNSPREKEAPGLYKKNLGGYEDLLKMLDSEKGAFEGIGSLGDVESRFGIKPFDIGGYQSQVKNTFGPARRNLATNLAQQRSSIASRLGSNAATPEFAFQPAESNYASALGNLESDQAGAMLGGYDRGQNQDMFIANFLKDILGEQQGYGERKFGRKLHGLGAKTGALNQYTNSLSDASTFDDILALGNTASKFIQPFDLFGGGDEK